MGSEIELRLDHQVVTIVEVGGGLRAYAAHGRPVLDGYDPGVLCSGSRGQVLAPWPNRLRDGMYTFAEQNNQLALTEPARHNAIHGLVQWVSWTVTDRDDGRATLSYLLRPQPGWPFTLQLETTYRLSSDGLRVTMAATNLGATSCPFGYGAHPYLRLAPDTIDSLELRIPATSWLRTDDQGIPVGKEPVDGTKYDFREGRLIGQTELDTAFGDLARDPDGRSRAALADPTAGDTVEVWMDESFTYLMVYSGDTLPLADRRRGIAIEPMSCAPNAFQSGDGLLVLAPGESHVSEWGIIP
jgi:aldose 1-epimerase